MDRLRLTVIACSSLRPELEMLAAEAKTAITLRHLEMGLHQRSANALHNALQSAIEAETGLALTPENFDIFLCGNPGMIETVIGWAEERGFVRDKGHDIGTLHTEEYW